jgi:hypothetical protein
MQLNAILDDDDLGTTTSRSRPRGVDDGFREHLATTQEYSPRRQPTAVAMDGRAL